MTAPSTAPAYVAERVAMWRRDGTNAVVALACDLIDALAADRDDAFARMIATERRADSLSAELAAMRERAERAEADVHGLVGCEWPGRDQPSTSYRISSSWEGRLCKRHADRPGPVDPSPRSPPMAADTPTADGLARALALVDALEPRPRQCGFDPCAECDRHGETLDAVFAVARAAVVRAMAWQDADTPEGDPVTYAMDVALFAAVADLVRLATGAQS